MTTSHGSFGPTWIARAGDDGRVDWRAVRRHTRRVRLLRVALPAIAAVLTVSMFISFAKLPLGIGDLTLGQVGVDGSTVTMAHPSLSGYGNRGTSYEVTAERALQDLNTPDVVRLESLVGRMEREDGTWTRLEARNGTYDSADETLRLENDIVIVTHDDRRVYLEDADVDLTTQNVVTDRSVRVETPDSRISGEGLEIVRGGERITLRRNVRVEILDAKLLKGDGDGAP